jgi:hypothetical protein
VEPADTAGQRQLLVVDRDDNLDERAHQDVFPEAAAKIWVPRPEQS